MVQHSISGFLLGRLNKISPRTSILIVDDKPELAMSLHDILVSLGHEAETANDGSKAIELVEARPFDILLIDIRMPGINGIDAFREIKLRQPTIEVIMMTAFTIDEVVSDALENGAYGILFKPFDVRKLLELVTKIEAKKAST